MPDPVPLVVATYAGVAAPNIDLVLTEGVAAGTTLLVLVRGNGLQELESISDGAGNVWVGGLAGGLVQNWGTVAARDMVAGEVITVTAISGEWLAATVAVAMAFPGVPYPWDREMGFTNFGNVPYPGTHVVIGGATTPATDRFGDHYGPGDRFMLVSDFVWGNGGFSGGMELTGTDGFTELIGLETDTGQIDPISREPIDTRILVGYQWVPNYDGAASYAMLGALTPSTIIGAGYVGDMFLLGRPKVQLRGLDLTRLDALDGSLFVARADSTGLYVDRYGASGTVETSVLVDVSHFSEQPRIRATTDGYLHLAYRGENQNFALRHSPDAGRTWTVAEIIASEVDGVAYDWTHPRAAGNYPVLAFLAGGRWKVRVGKPQVNNAIEWSDPVDVGVDATGAAAHPQGALRQRADGVWELLYENSEGNRVIVRCSSLKQDGTGTWE